MPRLFLVLVALGLAGCAVPPVVTAYNGDSVTIKTIASARTALADAEAQRLCARNNRPNAEFLSTTPVAGTWDQEHLYACLAT